MAGNLDALNARVFVVVPLLVAATACGGGSGSTPSDDAATDARARDGARPDEPDGGADGGGSTDGGDVDLDGALPGDDAAVERDGAASDASDVPDGSIDDGGVREGGPPRDGGPSAGCVGSIDCDDGNFCNGRERCAPMDAMADGRGCAPALDPRCLPTQTCDEAAMTCTSDCTTTLDADGDGHDAIACGGADCDDSRDDVFPGAPELCNGIDDSCDGRADEGDTLCDRPGTVGACVAGRCTIERCEPPFRDCNGDSDDGCEADLTASAAHCGACGTSCGPGATCTASTCDVVREVETGATHSCALGEGGAVACWGSNGRGELGIGTPGLPAVAPVSVRGLTDAIDLSLGNAFSCALRRGGTVVCWGTNDSGQLGDGSAMSGRDRAVPVPVVDVAGATAVACGGEHACALLADGSVRCWGRSLEGQLGDGSTAPRIRPVTVSGLVGVRAVVAGNRHTCAIRSDARAVCWGSNDDGQLGDGRGTLGVISTTPTEVSGLTEVATMGAGGSHTCARRTDGSIRCWGSNERGQLGDGTGGSGIIEPAPVAVLGVTGTGDVALGQLHSCAAVSGGAVACWGNASEGVLGDGVPPPTAGFPARAVMAMGLASVVDLRAGLAHTCARIAPSSLRCWGRNTSGQLGDGTGIGRPTPVAVVGFP